MRGSTHLLFGLVLSALLIELYNPSNPLLLVLLVLLGSLLPDIDEATSILGRRVPVVGAVARHRGFFHSVLFLVAMVVLLFSLLPNFHLAWFAGAFALHLALDAMTPKGVRPFWPSPLRLKGFVRVGGHLELLIRLAVLALFVWLLIT
jgi:inner membrane protein